MIIEHATIMKDGSTVIENGYLVVDADRIAALGSGELPAELLVPGAERIDASGKLIIAGLISTHVHLFQTLIRGLSDDRELIPWLTEVAFPLYEKMTPEDVTLATKMGMVEAIRGGATGMIDNITVKLPPEGFDAAMQVAEDLGVRYMLARGFSEIGYPDALMEKADDVIADVRQLTERWQGAAGGRLKVAISPNVVWGVTEETLVRINDLAREWGIHLHLHTAEDQAEVDAHLQRTGMRHVEWLDHLGVLGPHMQLAHAVWLDEHEISLLADSGTSVAHNPASNMFTAAGVARVPEMLAAGVHVALGTDGQACNNGQEMVDILKWAINAQRVTHHDAGALRPEQVLQIATQGGAYAFGEAERLGALEVGRQADLVILDMGDSRLTTPALSIPSMLVDYAQSRDVEAVMVAGEFLMRDREITMLDVGQLKADFSAARRALLLRAGI